MELEVVRRSFELREPLTTASGTIARRELLEVRLRDRAGRVGRGEAAPLAGHVPGTLAEAEAALEAYRPVLTQLGEAAAEPPAAPPGPDGPEAASRPGAGHAEALARCRALADLPPALAAIDVALWDLAGQRAGVEVAALLTRAPAREVAVNATLTASDRAGAAAQAAAAAAEGFRCVKAKVGIGDDAGRLAAVRAAAGPEMAIRVDANGAWEVDEAVAHLRALEPVGLELVEEPVHGVAALRELRREVDVWLAMDETAGEPDALISGAAHAACLKIARCGGITASLAAAREAERAGMTVYLASALDGPAGIAAAVHVAAALAPLPPCGLATLRAFADVDDPLPPRRGAIALPREPGLGLPESAP